MMRLLSLLLLLAVSAVAAQPRLAIVPSADNRSATFADLLTAELSKSADKFDLVERAELNRLAAEASIQALAANERPLALARLAKADGLIFVRPGSADAKNPRISVRLTGCADGLLHRTLLLGADDKDPATPARLAAAVLAFPAARLATPDEKPPIPVSLLGLRSTLGAHDPLAVMLNTALVHQLSSQPGLVVTERWKLDDVVFERTLSPDDAPPLATGTVSLEGSFERKDRALLASLRLRGAGSDETIRAESATGDPDAVIEELAKAVTLKLSGRALAKLDAGEEARRFADLGVWLLSRRLAVDAAQAFESAVALGDLRAETQMNRLKAYAAIICPMQDHISTYTPARTEVDGLDQMPAPDFRVALHAMIRISNLLLALVDGGWKGFEKLLPKPNDRLFIQRSVTSLGEQVLDALHRRKEHLRYADDARFLRARMRELVSKGTALYGAEFAGRDVHLGFIHETPAEAIAVFREGLAAKYLTATFESRGHLLRHSFWHTSRAPMERVVDWSQLGNEAGRQAWRAFAEELAASPELLAQTDGLAFIFQSATTDRERLAILERYLALAEAHLDKLATPEGQLTFYAFRPHWFGGAEGGQRDAKIVRQVQTRYLDVLSSVIEKAAWVEMAPLSVTEDVAHFLKYNQEEGHGLPPPESAARLLAAVQRFAERGPADPRWKLHSNRLMAATLKNIRERIARAYPALMPMIVRDREPVEGAVAIRAWQPPKPPTGVLQKLIGARREEPDEWLRSNRMIWDGERLLIAMNGPWLVSLDPATFEAKVMPFPQVRYDNWKMEACGGLMMIYCEELYVGDYRREPGQWKKLALPLTEPKQPLYWQPMAWNGALYAGSVLPRPAQHPQHWLARYENGALNWIVSSNRVPAQHPIDGKKPRNLLDLLPGPGGKPRLFVQLDEGGPKLEQLFDFETGNHLANLGSSARRLNVDINTSGLQKSGDRLLHWSQCGRDLLHLIEFGPDLEKPRLILRNPKPDKGLSPLGDGWEKIKPVLDYARCPLDGELIAPVGHAGKLWLLKWEPDDDTTLAHDPNGLRLIGIDLATAQTVVVPLRYDVDAALRAIKGPEGLDMSHPTIHPFSVTDTPGALFFAADGGETWTHELSPALLYVRWEEVNAWIHKNQPGFVK